MAQSGVLQASRVQLIRGLVRTMTMPTSPPTDLASLPQVSFPVGRADPVGNSLPPEWRGRPPPDGQIKPARSLDPQWTPGGRKWCRRPDLNRGPTDYECV